MGEIDYWLKKIDDRIFKLEVTIILTSDFNSKKRLIKLMDKEIEKKNKLLEIQKNMKKKELISFSIFVVLLIMIFIGISIGIWYYFPLIKKSF